METMTFKDYIETRYDVRDRIEQLKSNPILDFINSDIFPYDYLATENGELVKMLYYSDGEKEIAVLDLLAYTKEDLDKLKNNEDLKELYNTYTEQFDFDNTLDLEKIKEIREASLSRLKELRI